MSEQTASSYDEMPYINRAFPQTHPDRLATLAKLFGITAPDLETCRVLELGCASGDNLIPMAMGLPNGQFLGIDFSERQISQGQQDVKSLQLENIELRHANIAEVDASYGEFDYIICHGIYSWVPESIREKILAICRQHLAPQGVAYVSYNTLPGWHTRGMVRGMMLYHSGSLQKATMKVQQARALLNFLVQSVPTDTAYGITLKQELDVIRTQPDAYLFHDHLEETNEPMYFHQFAEAAGRHQLQYLAEANFSEMLISHFPPQVGETLRRIAPDVVRMEQYIDFLRNRTFRQTLLLHQGLTVQRNLEGQVLKGLYVVSPAQPVSAQPSLAERVAESFRSPNGATVATSNAVTKAALLLLAQRWPLGLAFEELVVAARSKLAASSGVNGDAATLSKDTHILGSDLLQCYAADVAELRVRAPRLCLIPSARPIASPLARLQVERDATVTNLLHGAVLLDAFGSRLLRLLDGTRDKEALVAAMAELVATGRLQMTHQSGESLIAALTQEEILRKSVDENLTKLAKSALLLD